MGREFKYFFHAQKSINDEEDKCIYRRHRGYESPPQRYEELNYISRYNNFIRSGTFTQPELRAEIKRLLKQLDKTCESFDIFEAIGALGMIGKGFRNTYVTIKYD